MTNKLTSIVLDCTFGDSGKGLLVDNLCTPESLVVRFSGGQQCGHTVVVDGVRHVFSNFGSGTFHGCPTYYTEDTTFYPNTMFREREILNNIGLYPKNFIHPLAMLTTPFDVAYNRAREEVKGHGTCGLGIGTTMTRNLKSGHKLYAIDIHHKSLLMEKLQQIKKYYEQLAVDENLDRYFGDEYKTFITNELINFFEHIKSLQAEPSWFKIKQFGDVISKTDYDHIVFEGSQGILLDMDHGSFPNVTFANTTCKNAIKYCKKFGLTPDIHYVTRCYLTRHGYGWMANETEIPLINNSDETNVYNHFQRSFRVGEFDWMLVQHAMNMDAIYHDGVVDEKYLTVTCLDQRPLDFMLGRESLAKTLNIAEVFGNDSPERGHWEFISRKSDATEH